MNAEIIAGFELSTQQQRIWNASGGAAPSVSFGLHILGKLRVDALERAVARLVRRHDILRTRFEYFDGADTPLQVIHDSDSWEVAAIPVSQATASDIDAVHAEFLVETTDSDSPALHCRLARLAPDEHLLSVRVSALCADLSSIRLLALAIAQEYANTDSDAGEPAMQYLQYAAWRSEIEESQLGARRTGRETATRFTTQLPYEKDARAADFESSFHSVMLHVPTVYSCAAIQIAQRQHQPSEAFWLACWYAVLWRFAPEPRVSIDYHCDCRNFDELAALIGPLAQFNFLTLNIAGDDTFDELLAAVGSAIAEFNEEAAPGAAPLNDSGAVIQFETLQVPELHMSDLQVRLHGPEANVERFKLKLSCMEYSNGALDMRLVFNPAYYTREAITHLGRCLLRLIQHVASTPEDRIDCLQLLTDEDQRTLLQDFNATQTPLPAALVHQQIDEMARRTRGAAIICEDGEISFEQLLAQSDSIAAYLQEHGVRPEDRVAVCMRRSPRLILTLLGIWKAGAAYIPLDPDDPPQRLDYTLQDCQPRLLLTERDCPTRLGDAVPSLLLDEQWDLIVSQSRRPAPLDVRGEHLAYIIYTSGSTGKPKGTCITHHGLLNYLQWACEYYAVALGNGSLLHSPITFDLSVTTLFAPLLAGRPLRLLPPKAGLDDLIRTLDTTAELSFLKLTPAHLDALAGQLTAAASGAARVLIIGGEALHGEQVESWRRQAPQVRLVNEYGPTETVVGCCIYEVEAGDARDQAVPIGKPIANTSLYVLDAHMEPVPLGVKGELYVGGAGVARGYHRRPALTAERFVPDPFAVQPGARLYRTGDAVRLSPGNELEFLGRLDQQIKIRGHRVELGEIENVLRTHPEVRETVVVLRAQAAGDMRLIAYVVAKGGKRLALRDLREYLLQRLPEYMIPATVITLDALPLTRGGKIDRRALPEPASDEELQFQSYRPPQSLTEEVLAAIWGEVLRRERVGIDDNFFVLGGDSIRSIRLRALAAQRGLQIGTEELFRHQTIRELAAQVRLGDGNVAADLALIAPFALISEADRQRLPATLEDAFPLSALQAGMVFHSEMAPASGVFHDVHTIDLRIPFDAGALRAAMDLLFKRHPVLRGSFDLGSYGKPLMLIHREVHIPLEVVDARNLPQEQRKQMLDSWLENEPHNAIDLTRAPLLRFVVHRLTEETCRFSFSFHHAVLDGWSVATLFTELFQTYLSFRQGAPSPLPEETPVAFRDFVALEQTTIQSPQAATFWANQLEDNRSRPLPVTRQADRSGVHFEQVPLPEEVTRGIRKLSGALAVPIKSILLAAHLRVLGHWTGQSDVMTGLVSNGRPESLGGERVLGLFLNTVPLRTRLDGKSWQALITAVFETERDLLPHRRYPLALLQQRNAGQKLFDTAFNFMHYHVYQSLENLSSEVELLDWGGYEEIDFPLMANFSLDLASSDVVLQLSCRRENFTQQQIERIAASYAAVLGAMVADPSRDCGTIELLPADERRQVLHEWNDTRHLYSPGHLCLHELIREQARKTPQHCALIFEDRQLTYTELDQQSDRLAARLALQGAGAETIVAVCAERSVEMVVALIAILKSGAAYLPLDPEQPTQRLRSMLQHSRAAVVVAQEAFMKHFEDIAQPLIALQAHWPEEIASARLPTVNAEQPAYVIYTSGTTGMPKGVVVPHAGVVNRLLWGQQRYALDGGDRVLQKTPYTFDVSVWEFFWPLVSGATLVVARPGGHRDPDYLVRLIDEQRVTVLHFVPSMLSAFLQTAPASALPSVRRVFCSGEALMPDQVERFFKFCGAELHNLYGPTEASIEVSHWPCQRDEQSRGVPIGHPIANTQLYVLDGTGKPVPAGVSGELYLGGRGVVRGYLGQPALTAERFVPDPFGELPGARLYRTGDRVRHLPDGAIEFLGRADQQLKLRGFRVEPAEIEQTLILHPQVEQAVVMPFKRDAHVALIAYVVAQSGTTLSTPDLRDHLKQRLPEYMVPAQFMMLDSLPLNANGKLNRQALPAAESQPMQSQREYRAPRNELERKLCEIWQEVLMIERIGAADNFFDLGGHSLPAIQVISRLRQALSVELPLNELFDFPTVEKLAARVSELQRAQVDRGGKAPILPRPSKRKAAPTTMVYVDERLGEMESGEILDEEPTDADAGPASADAAQLDVNPLTYDQERVWHLEQENRGRFRYTVSFMFRLQGPLDRQALTASLNEIARRHEVLRSRFLAIDAQPVQIVDPHLCLDAAVIPLRHHPAERREEMLQELAAEESRRPFDLGVGPLVRATLFDLQSEEHVLLVVMHAIVMDAWSTGILLRELGLLYLSYSRGETPMLPELNVQVADYAHWERHWIGTQQLPSLLDYWLTQLPGPLTPINVPGRRDNDNASERGASLTVPIDPDLAGRMLQYGREQGLTPFMIALAGFKLLLNRRAGANTVCVGVGVAMRNRVEIESLIGSFMNILPFNTDFTGEPTFEEALRRVRDVTLGAFAHQSMPWTELVRALRERGRITHGLPTRIMADHLTISSDAQQVGELRVLPVAPERQEQVTGSELTFRLQELPDSMATTMFYRTDLFDRETIESLQKDLRTLLWQGLTDPSMPISGLLR